MNSIITEPLDGRIKYLEEQTTLVTALLDQSYINQDVFNRCLSETQSIIQSKPTLRDDPTEDMWNVYREFLLDQYLDASRRSPDDNKLNTIPDGIRLRSSKFIIEIIS